MLRSPIVLLAAAVFLLLAFSSSSVDGKSSRKKSPSNKVVGLGKSAPSKDDLKKVCTPPSSGDDGPGAQSGQSPPSALMCTVFADGQVFASGVATVVSVAQVSIATSTFCQVDPSPKKSKGKRAAHHHKKSSGRRPKCRMEREIAKKPTKVWPRAQRPPALRLVVLYSS